jgi:hypothetical protein
MKNVILLPTDKPSRLVKNTERKLKLTIQTLPFDNIIGCYPHHIYITSTEEIKVGDWYYLPRTNSVHKCIEDPTELNLERRLGVAKIILTTDPDLIKDGVQAIDDEFLEWFVKNPSCEEVEVSEDYFKPSNMVYGHDTEPYKIIIPKEEQKQHIIDMMKSDEELGLYEEPKQICECIDECLGYLTKECKKIEETKQETLEEAAERNYNEAGVNAYFNNGFIRGAKWQEKRMYSEEEVETIAKDAYAMGRNNILIGVFNKWFEQFKKK